MSDVSGTYIDNVLNYSIPVVPLIGPEENWLHTSTKNPLEISYKQCLG